MFKVKMPFYKVDESSGWDVASLMSETTETVDEVQPETDTETETLEEPTVSEQEVEPDTEPNNEEIAEESDEEPEAKEEPAFNDETEIDLGEGRQPIKLAELKQGYLRQSDYTKKTQELATQRKELETQQESLKPTQEWLTYMNANPYLFNQLNQAIQQWEQTGILPIEEIMENAETAKYVNHFMAENKRLQTELDRINGEYEGVKLTSSMTQLKSELKADYGDLVTDEYMNTLQERAKTEKLSTATLKDIAEGYLAKQKLQTQKDPKQVTKEAEAKTIQGLQERRNNLPPQPKSTGQRPSPEETDTSTLSWFDIAKRSMAK